MAKGSYANDNTPPVSTIIEYGMTIRIYNRCAGAWQAVVSNDSGWEVRSRNHATRESAERWARTEVRMNRPPMARLYS